MKSCATVSSDIPATSVVCMLLDPLQDLRIYRHTLPSPRRCSRGGVPCFVQSSSRQLVEQCLGVLQIYRVKPLAEPAVDLRQQLSRFGPLPLALPHPAQAHRRLQLPPPGPASPAPGPPASAPAPTAAPQTAPARAARPPASACAAAPPLAPRRWEPAP